MSEKKIYGLLRYFFNTCLQSNCQRAPQNGTIIDVKNMTLFILQNYIFHVSLFLNHKRLMSEPAAQKKRSMLISHHLIVWFRLIMDL
jgi:hypothetical protein